MDQTCKFGRVDLVSLAKRANVADAGDSGAFGARCGLLDRLQTRSGKGIERKVKIIEEKGLQIWECGLE